MLADIKQIDAHSWDLVRSLKGRREEALNRVEVKEIAVRKG